MNGCASRSLSGLFDESAAVGLTAVPVAGKVPAPNAACSIQHTRDHRTAIVPLERLDTMVAASTRPVIALAMGDPAGISPELTAKALALPEVREAADFVVFGDARVLAAGARAAGVERDVEVRRAFVITLLRDRGRFSLTWDT